MRRAVAFAVVAAMPAIAACQPPPPKTPCDPITEAQHNRTRPGMSLADVEWNVEHKLVLSNRFESPRYPPGSGQDVYETWVYDLDWDVHGCGQYVSYSFDNGALRSSSWMKVVK
jgi:hypothetical protein